MQQSTIRLIAIFAGLGVIAWVAWAYFNPSPESNPIVADGAETVTILPLSEIEDFEDPSVGWTHEQFWMVPPMTLAHVEKNGKPALRCETNGNGSILTRTTDIELGDYPTLVWDWFIEMPISSPIDEDTVEGDDHPARILISLEDRTGGEYAFEIIWSNRKYEPGDYKYIGDFAHYVANGLNENTRMWHHQEVNLMQVYWDVTGRNDYPMIKSIGIFCDSDDTKTRSVAYFSDIELRAR